MAIPLIDKLDNHERITEAIGAILRAEFASQIALANAAGELDHITAAELAIAVYVELSNPWDAQNTVDGRRMPVVNVTFERCDFQRGESNTYQRQTAEGVFNVDAYGFGVASETAGPGHNPGDRQAAIEAKRTIRFVRNILMAAEHRYLGLRGVVQSRWLSSIQILRPEGLPDVEPVIAARLPLVVDYTETAPQVEALEISELGVEVTHGTRGEAVRMQFDV